MTTSPERADVAIVGSGPIGAVVASQIRDALPDATIVMVEAGPRVGPQPGTHLLTSDDPEARAAYAIKAKPGVQTKYVGATAGAVPTDAAEPLEPGVVPAGSFGENADEMPGAALAWNVGGMGVHWTAAAPWPYGAEIPTFISPAEWSDDLTTAQRLLQVTSHAYPQHPSGVRLVDKLRAVFPTAVEGRDVQDMPMAGRHDSDGLFHRTGPADIFPPIGGADDDHFTLLSDTLCTRFDETETGVTLHLRSTTTDQDSRLEARAVVVAADVLRSPQLLHASGITGDALGRYLNEHVFLTGAAALDDPDVPVTPEVEPFDGSYWLPSTGITQPFHGQLMETTDPATNRHSLGLSWYVPTEIQRENRVTFSDTELDRVGMPRLTIRYRLSDNDKHLIETGRKSQLRGGEAVGTFDGSDTELLPLGGSLHSTGTVRIGAADDGTSVANKDGLVWGTERVFVAGNGAVPTALTCNSTLTAAVLAVRTARAIIHQVTDTAIPYETAHQ